MVKKSLRQKEVISNLEKSRQEVLHSFKHYTKIVFEAKYKATYGTVLKILTPKQIVQRSPIALAQVKAGNDFESLLNKIREIAHSLYQSKILLRKYTITLVIYRYYIYELWKVKFLNHIF